MPRLECRIARFRRVKRPLSISAVQAAACASGLTPACPVQRGSSDGFAGCAPPGAVTSAAMATASENDLRFGNIGGFYRRAALEANIVGDAEHITPSAGPTLRWSAAPGWPSR